MRKPIDTIVSLVIESRIEEGAEHWLKHPFRAYKAHQRSGGKDTALTGGMGRNNQFRGIMVSGRKIASSVKSLHQSMTRLNDVADSLNKQLSTPEGKKAFLKALQKRNSQPKKDGPV
jgi:hypothetical protein